ncbi:hypothetical protein [Sinorhizobium fredii]|uniref:hypothetical protein n=1 Tax=Rhizobium fredii TaxID=380 RepID=UPI003391CFA0
MARSTNTSNLRAAPPWSGSRSAARGSGGFERLGPEYVVVADLIANWLAYNSDRIAGMKAAGRRALLRQVERLGSFWGKMTVAEIGADTSRQYQSGRNQNSVRIELARLRSIVELGARVGLVDMGGRIPDYDLPPGSRSPRSFHHCSRAEVAKLVRAAYRGDGERAMTIHVARLILTACYLGVKAWIIGEASFQPEEARPWADLENGVFYPRSLGAKPSRGSMHADPIPIPTRLLMHMRRWRNGRPGESGARYIVERQGRPVGCRSEFRSLTRKVMEERGREVTCHTLRNTCTAWLRAGDAPREIVLRFRSQAPDYPHELFFIGPFPSWWRTEVDMAFARARLRLRGDGGY